MSLTQRFLAGRKLVSAARDSASEDNRAQIEAALVLAVGRARAACPREAPDDFDDGDVAEELGAAMGVVDGDLVGALTALHAADLHLACACGRGEPSALAQFEERFVACVPRWVARLDRSPEFSDEVRQKLRETMLLGGPRTGPKISSYCGRGSLEGWLRVATIRMALNLRRAARSGGPLTAAAGPTGVGAAMVPDPELDYLKSKYAPQFREAFVAAITNLSVEERNALRFHYLDGLTLDETAAACHVHRATAARWLAHARESLLRDTRRLLLERTKLGHREVESMFRLVESQLDVSLRRHLAESGDVGRAS